MAAKPPPNFTGSPPGTTDRPPRPGDEEETAPAEGEGGGDRRPRRVGVLVQEGDTLRTLAERITGDPNNWRQLKEAGITADDLVVGSKVRVPRRLLSDEFKEGRREGRFIRKQINSDLAYQEFRAQNKLDRALLLDEQKAAEDAHNNLIQRMAAGWEQERLNALTQSANEWEDRGLHSSGARVEDSVRIGAEEDRARNEWQTQQQNELNDQLGSLQQELLGLRVAGQQQRLAARDRAGREWAQKEAERIALGGAPRPQNQTESPRRPRGDRRREATA